MQPGASRAGVVGLHGDELKVRVTSPPLDGRANSELCEVLAAVLGVRARDIRVDGGHSSRSKSLVVAATTASVSAALAPWIGPDAAPRR
ncbi:MAG: DUF167 domain-containing protein [Ilumatobacteraceae bacterium]|nr:DUF167 domain-containing protein [Ilumatobacteraceae bacterium]